MRAREGNLLLLCLLLFYAFLLIELNASVQMVLRPGAPPFAERLVPVSISSHPLGPKAWGVLDKPGGNYILETDGVRGIRDRV
jgi:hypothetical protein